MRPTRFVGLCYCIDILNAFNCLAQLAVARPSPRSNFEAKEDAFNSLAQLAVARLSHHFNLDAKYA